MDYVRVLDKTDAYIKQIVNSDEFGILLDLKERIQIELIDFIQSFKTAKEKYEEATNYGTHHPDLKQYQIDLSEAKTKLYSQELVKKYFEVQKLIQTNIDLFINDLTSSISNKFKQIQSIDL